MAQTVVMPKLGNTVESCIIVGWKVEEGAHVSADTMICEIETDKATMEVPAGVEGVLLKILRPAGDDVPVLEAIAIVGAAGEALGSGAAGTETGAGTSKAAGVAAAAPDKASASSASEATGAASAAAQAAPASAPGAAGETGFASPRARSLAAERSLPLSAIAAGSGPGGRIIERDVAAVLAAGPGATASARDLEALKALYASGRRPAGTGLGGRLTAADLAASPGDAVAAPGAAAQAPAAGAFPGPYADTPIRSIRKIIADRMLHSIQSSAQLTFNASAPAGRILALRARFKNSSPELGLSGVTIGDLVAYSAVKVMADFPKLNAYVVDGALRSFAQVHLGLAVDTPRGLMVPTVRNAGALSLRDFSALSKKLASESLAGSVNPDLLTGGTFTVTNLGAFGIESFTPILNEPQTAILGVDNIVPRPTIAADGAVGAEMRIGFSLTVDHRVVDGADAARYLKALSDYIANIDLVLLG
jgi:pyruvate dehydrogenase E2 component (dihydrolipoamide acetyltransferase)